jgi:hypothetical protein
MVAPVDERSAVDGGNVRVVARIRPLSEREKTEGSKETVTHLQQQHETDAPALVQVHTGSKRWFELDAVFGKDSTQVDVYHESGAKRAVETDLFAGFNCTILAYGQTGAGKTHTMGTASTNGGDITETDGIIPRACADLFRTIAEKCDGNAKVELSYLELYNEEIRDLFAPKQTEKAAPLKIRENLNGEVYVSGVVSRPVTSPQEIGKLMEEASKRRVTAATAMNAVSSRSHAICTLRIEGILEGPDGADKFQSKLTLVDLAGSERIKKTGAQGARQTEGININKSLLVLGQVVSALSEQGKRRRKPPYRDSKLTRLLQDSLGGNSRTIMVACVSPADFNVDESINTLRYACSARNIKNKATRNLVKNISPEEAAKLQRENQLLRKQVAELQEMLKGMSSSSSSSPTNRTASTVSVASSVDASVDDENGDDARSVDDSEPTIPKQIDVEDDRVYRLEKEVTALKKQLRAAKEEAQKAIEVPTLHLEISQLKEQLEESKQIAEENDELQRELSEAKTDAESARMAACYLSDIVDSLKEIKRDEIDRKIESLQQVQKEQQWISFVHVMLGNFKMQISDLSNDFQKKVVKAIESLQFGKDKEDQEEFVRKAVERKKSRPWWKGKPEENPSWTETTVFFKARMKEIEDNIQFEAESLKGIQKTLVKECTSLEQEIGAERLKCETMATGKDRALVDQLTSMLLGPKTAVQQEDVALQAADISPVVAVNKNIRVAETTNESIQFEESCGKEVEKQ